MKKPSYLAVFLFHAVLIGWAGPLSGETDYCAMTLAGRQGSASSQTVVTASTEQYNWRVYSDNRPLGGDALFLGAPTNIYQVLSGPLPRFPGLTYIKGTWAPESVSVRSLFDLKADALEALYHEYSEQSPQIRSEIGLYKAQDQLPKSLHLLQTIREGGSINSVHERLHAHSRFVSSRNPEDKLPIQWKFLLPIKRRPNDLWVEMGRTIFIRKKGLRDEPNRDGGNLDIDEMKHEFYLFQFASLEREFDPDRLILQMSGSVFRGFLLKFPFLKPHLQVWHLQSASEVKGVDSLKDLSKSEDYAIILTREGIREAVNRLTLQKIVGKFIKALSVMNEPNARFVFNLSQHEDLVLERVGVNKLLTAFYEDHPDLEKKNWLHREKVAYEQSLRRGEFAVWLLSLSTAAEIRGWTKEPVLSIPQPSEILGLFKSENSAVRKND